MLLVIQMYIVTLWNIKQIGLKIIFLLIFIWFSSLHSFRTFISIIQILQIFWNATKKHSFVLNVILYFVTALLLWNIWFSIIYLIRDKLNKYLISLLEWHQTFLYVMIMFKCKKDFSCVYSNTISKYLYFSLQLRAVYSWSLSLNL